MTDFERVSMIIDFLAENRHAQPSLDQLSEVVGLSSPHLQRLFLRWAGVSPKKFLQLLTLNSVRQRLMDGSSVLEAALREGLSGPSRLHDLTVSLEAASPGEIKTGGEGWIITAGYASSPFGDCLIAKSPRGICRLEFIDKRDTGAAEKELLADWPRAEISWSDAEANCVATQAFLQPRDAASELRCFVNGSQFQLRVWQALLRVPVGQLATYEQIAKAIGKPKASRAVGTAIGSNPVGYLIPCHRVIRKTGIVGAYKWGATRKHAIITRELSQATP